MSDFVLPIEAAKKFLTLTLTIWTYISLCVQHQELQRKRIKIKTSNFSDKLSGINIGYLNTDDMHPASIANMKVYRLSKN